ncbi:MAG: MFS transporter [Candidatus Omnitrophica bacterium]|nr:MFS transporter [Candidatus Omnitrophota bacterium]
MKKNSGALITVFLAVLIDLMGFGIVLPLLPFYASAFNASPVTIGLLYSIYSFAQLVFAPIWGGLSDRIGRRPIMLISTFGAAIAYVLFGLAHSLFILFLSRLIAGIMGGNISTAQAYVADVTTPEDRAKGMGLIGAAFGIGFLLGPAIASVLIHPAFMKLFHISEHNRFAIPGFFAALMSTVSFLLVMFKLPETVGKTPADNGKLVKISIFTPQFWNMIFHDKKSRVPFLFPMLIGCMLLSSFGQSSLYSSFPLFCESSFKVSAENVGFMFAFMGLINVVVQGGLIRMLLKRFSEEVLFLSGAVFMSAGFSLVSVAHSKNILILFLAIMAIGWSLVIPTLSSLISKEADPSQVGATMGISQGMASLGRVIGPTWGGFLYAVAHRLPFAATGAILFLMVLVGLKIKPGLNTLER